MNILSCKNFAVGGDFEYNPPMEYTPTIGLEIHAELATETKMFCCSKNDPDEKRPNVNICPVCMAHPGTLPVINKGAVRHVIRVGTAMGGTIADFTEFDRKNYFYPDIPKGYQISQYKLPIVSGGSLEGVAITRIHLEEDTARSQHEEDGDTLVDYNRAGVPLMELVTEPVIKSAEEAGKFARSLRLLLRALGASEANMEKGEMRVEANVSVSNVPGKFGTKVEVKNINSFKAVESAIRYEVDRQIEVLSAGGVVVQETRGWSDAGSKTFSQRLKEEAFDYRYFPEPDLPKLYLSKIPEFQNIKAGLPELPSERSKRLLDEFGLSGSRLELLVSNFSFGKFFDEVSSALSFDRGLTLLAANYITSDLINLVSEEIPEHLTPSAFAELVRMTERAELGSRGAKDVLALMVLSGGDPKKIADEKGLIQKSDQSALEVIAEEVILKNEKAVTELRAGKTASLQFLVGQGMKLSKGSANPALLAKIITEKLLA